MKTKWQGPRGKFFIFLMIFCLLIPLTDGIHHVVNAQSDADSTNIPLTESADGTTSDITGDVPNAEDYDVVADDDGNVYINGMLVQDGDVLPDGSVVSIGDVNDEADTGLSEDEPFTLSIPFVDTETAVAFLPTEEGVEIQQEMLYGQDSAARDSENKTVLPEDGRVELTIQIAPGKKEQPEVPLKFGLEIRNGMYADLLVWDSESQQFSDALTVYDVVPEAEKSVALTLLIPPDLAERLRGTIGDSQTFKIVSWMEDAPDAKVQVSDLMVVNLPERFADMTDEDSERSHEARQVASTGTKKTYSKTFGSRVFSIEFSAGSESDLNCRGEYTKVSAGVSSQSQIRIFRMTLPPFSESKSLSYYDYIHDEFSYGSSSGSSYCSCDCISGTCEPSCQCDPDCKGSCACNLSPNSCDIGCSCDPDCTRTIKQDFQTVVKSLGKQLFSYAKTGSAKVSLKRSFTQRVSVKYVVVIFIIPVELEAGAYGELGLQFDFGADHYTKFYAKAGPFVDAGAFASAKVTAFVAWAGIRGNLSLIKDEFWGEASCAVDFRNGGRDLLANLGLRVWNDLYGPSGFLQAYAGYCYPWICKKEVCIGGGGGGKKLFGLIKIPKLPKICVTIWYPCVQRKEKPWTLADWHSFHIDSVLLDWNDSKTIRLIP